MQGQCSRGEAKQSKEIREEEIVAREEIREIVAFFYTYNDASICFFIRICIMKIKM